jgi:hypothetical protein
MTITVSVQEFSVIIEALDKLHSYKLEHEEYDHAKQLNAITTKLDEQALSQIFGG